MKLYEIDMEIERLLAMAEAEDMPYDADKKHDWKDKHAGGGRKGV